METLTQPFDIDLRTDLLWNLYMPFLKGYKKWILSTCSLSQMTNNIPTFWNVLMIKIIQGNRVKDIINVYVVY